MTMSDTKSIITEKEIFAENMLQHEERSKLSTYNLPNFTNPLAYNTEAINDTSTFKESTIQPVRLDLVDATRKEIGAH